MSRSLHNIKSKRDLKVISKTIWRRGKIKFRKDLKRA
jgi:hypothetical protein